MEVFVTPDPASAADHFAVAIRAAIEARGRCILGLSGGRTPAAVLRVLGMHPIPWDRVHVVQVDERQAPEDHPDRNLVGLRAALPEGLRIYPMPVDWPDADASYGALLRDLCGEPPAIDVVHLGLGDDGHTASLVPGDPALVATAPVAWTGVYQGRRRLTLTYPTLDAARLVLWLVSGASKQPMVERLLAGDGTIPAGRVRAPRQILLCDPACAPGGP